MTLISFHAETAEVQRKQRKRNCALSGSNLPAQSFGAPLLIHFPIFDKSHELSFEPFFGMAENPGCQLIAPQNRPPFT